MNQRLVVLISEGETTARYVFRDADATWTPTELKVTGTRLNGSAFSGTVTYPRERVLSVEEAQR